MERAVAAHADIERVVNDFVAQHLVPASVRPNSQLEWPMSSAAHWPYM
jgi:hypothetical protein